MYGSRCVADGIGTVGASPLAPLSTRGSRCQDHHDGKALACCGRVLRTGSGKAGPSAPPQSTSQRFEDPRCKIALFCGLPGSVPVTTPHYHDLARVRWLSSHSRVPGRVLFRQLMLCFPRVQRSPRAGTAPQPVRAGSPPTPCVVRKRTQNSILLIITSLFVIWSRLPRRV